MKAEFLKSLIERKNFKIKTKKAKKLYLIFIFSIFFIFIFSFILFSAPSDFPKEKIIKIEKGENLVNISEKLKEESVIKSSFFFQTFSILTKDEKGVLAGYYSFDEKESLFSVVKRLTEGKYGIDPVRITIPEGSHVEEIADILNSKIDNFDEEKFLTIAQKENGFLFPDTYFFMPNISEENIVNQLKETFKKKTKELKEESLHQNKNFFDIVIMASIIEKEAFNSNERKIISGILWKRIEKGMPLQVDAPFLYLNGKTSAELTIDDLDQDSEYNTYKYYGLPPKPITNPGFDSIKAALNPKKSPYLFYLHGKNGNIHYAENFEEHKENKRKYL